MSLKPYAKQVMIYEVRGHKSDLLSSPDLNGYVLFRYTTTQF